MLPAGEKMTPTDGLPELPGIDKQDGLRRMMNKAPLYERILRDFHERFRDEATLVRAAIAAGDYAAAERRIHSTKGLAGSIGAIGLQDAARMLEGALRQNTAPDAAAIDLFENELRTVIDGIAQGFAIGPAA